MAGAAARTLGVCYYPEHWPESRLETDAAMMADLGITFVRIGEFAWSRLEPKRGDFQFGWLERAIEALAAKGLRVILGTPTATPPKWLVDEMPEMLPINADGRVRGFGSRRHYSFAHQGYRAECRRIATALARRFGHHEAVTGWQIDNEYDCHDTTLSFGKIDLAAFREWLSSKYQSPDALNRAWGNVFWSKEITDFNEIELPNQTVTEANPAHWMDFRRFSSDQVVALNRMQADVLRKYSPGRDILHNFMGRTLAYDHFEVGADLDVSTWDSYPLGFLEDRSDRDDAFKAKFARTGDPDFQAFHHDLYRATSDGRWWVMEQQPGPVNWAPHNPAPRAGMVTLWTLEALAHGAEAVSYFRWRQAPFAQEQMHSGLLRPDGQPAEGYNEVSQAGKILDQIKWPEPEKSEIAIVFDYPSAWAWEIQPQGKEFNYFRLVYDVYKALRQMGLSVDFVPATSASLGGYRLVCIPGLFTFSAELTGALEAFDGEVLIGPRSGSKTLNFSIPATLPPNLPQTLLDVTIERVESLRPDCPVSAGHGNLQFWREFARVAKPAGTTLETEDGHPAVIRQNNITYLCGWPNKPLMLQVLKDIAARLQISIRHLPDGLRLRQNGTLMFVMNYDGETHDLAPLDLGTLVHGDMMIPPSGFSIFRAAE